MTFNLIDMTLLCLFLSCSVTDCLTGIPQRIKPQANKKKSSPHDRSNVNQTVETDHGLGFVGGQKIISLPNPEIFRAIFPDYLFFSHLMVSNVLCLWNTVTVCHWQIHSADHFINLCNVFPKYLWDVSMGHLPTSNYGGAVPQSLLSLRPWNGLGLIKSHLHFQSFEFDERINSHKRV